MFSLVARLVIFLFLLVNAFGQAQFGEMRVTVTDASGLAVPAAVNVVSEVNQYQRSFEAGADGRVVLKRLPFGLYTVKASHAGLATASKLVDIRSAIPKDLKIVLAIAPVESSVDVSSNETLLDPYRTNSVNRIGGDQIRDRFSSSPGRSIAELVNQQPGWMFEANGILHPRGEEYQMQYLMDGVPLTDNRSAAFIADLDVDNVVEMSTMTAGFPAEYGRKMGGVVEVQTERDDRRGFHGRAVVSGGSFNTGSAYAQGQQGWGNNTLSFSASGALTDRFLDPPVTENYTNHGALASFMGHYEKDVDEHNRIGVIARREQSRFLVPNELIQQAAGQRQDRNGYETAVQFSYTHIFSPDVIGDFRAMSRDITAGLWSNPFSTPMIVDQGRSYREAYAKAAISVHHGAHEFKVGGEGDFANIRERLSYLITNPDQFDPGTPLMFRFLGRGRDREQSAFVQDVYRWKNFTLSAGVRFDHYSLIVDQTAWSPRFGLAYYWPWADIVFHASYDRIFQTPPFENILVSSSPDVVSLNDHVLRLPVQPARGEYVEAGFSKAFLKRLRMDTNFYHRYYTNYPDDDLLLNTGVSFPVTFAKANIYGVEVKMDVPHWGPFSGYASWSQQRGNGYYPVTGGLFLGDDAQNAINPDATVFPVSQEQRNTLRGRVRYQIVRRAWMAIGATYDSGLPFEFTGTKEEAIEQYGQNIVGRLNFSNERTRPLFSLNASVGVVLNESEKHPLRLQIDGNNLTNQLHVINFDGLFSGTALGVPRSVAARLQMDF